jgi:hypothetical protein
VEIQREGQWVEVREDKPGGRSGWIHVSLVYKKFTGGEAVAEKDPRFEKFEAAFNELNASVARKTGMTAFTKAEHLGDGIIRVTATETWLSAPRLDRQDSLRTVFDMWDAAEGSGLPIAVYVVDESGKRHMYMKRTSPR